MFLAVLRHGDGSKLKVLEALAVGLSLASTAQGISGLELRDGEDYLGGGTAEQLVNAVVRLLQDPARARVLGQNGRVYACRAHDWSIAVSQLEQVYAGLAGRASAYAQDLTTTLSVACCTRVSAARSMPWSRPWKVCSTRR